jgi:hypothetical protein
MKQLHEASKGEETKEAGKEKKVKSAFIGCASLLGNEKGKETELEEVKHKRATWFQESKKNIKGFFRVSFDLQFLI